MRRALRYLRENVTFARLWAGQGISTFGDVLYDVAVVWYVLTTTGSAFSASGIAVATIGGRIVGGAAAGPVLSRMAARSVMLRSDLARCGLTLALGAPWSAGSAPPLPVLYLLAFALALGTGLFTPARMSAVPEVVPREELIRANALDALSQGAVSAAAWGGSGVAVAFLGPAQALVLDAATFLASYVVVAGARWQNDTRPLAPTLPGDPGGPRDGLVRDRIVRGIIALEAVHALAMGFFLSGLPLLVYELGGGADAYGLQGGLFWAALMVASIAIVSRPIRRPGRLYAAGVIVNAVGNEVLGLSPTLGTVFAGVLIAGVGWPAWTSGRQALLQAAVPREVRSRAFAILESMTNAAFLPAWLVGGWLADELGPRAVMAAAPLVHLGIGVLLLSTRPVRAFALAPASSLASSPRLP